MNAFVAKILADGHTDKTVQGLGALKGTPCTIESAVPFTEGTKTGNLVTFKWTANNGTTERLSIKVYNGEDGVGSGSGGTCTCDDIQDITDAEINAICKL